MQKLVALATLAFVSSCSGGLKSLVPPIGGGSTASLALGTVYDGRWQASTTTSPRLAWSLNTETDLAQVKRFELAIGTSAGASDVRDWAGVGTTLVTLVSGLTLTDGTTYYASVRAVGMDDAVGDAISSDGWTVRMGAGFGPYSTLAANPAPRGVAVGDLNGDNHVDLVSLNGGTGTSISAFLNTGLGTFGTQLDATVILNPQEGRIADFDGDGVGDLTIITFSPGDLSFLKGQGNGTFAAPVVTNFMTNTSGLVTHDFTGDGKLDAVVTHFDAALARIVTNNGTGGFASSATYATAAGAKSVVVGDYNGDGRGDLAVAAATADMVSVLIGKSDGTFETKVDYAVGDQPIIVAQADFDSDGDLDLAVTNQTGNTLSVLMGAGNGAFASALTYPVAAGASPHGLLAADLNGDGAADLVSTDSLLSTVSYFANRGDGTFLTPIAINVGAAAPVAKPYRLVSADLNRDGVPDLAVANRDEGNLSVLLGTP